VLDEAQSTSSWQAKAGFACLKAKEGQGNGFHAIGLDSWHSFEQIENMSKAAEIARQARVADLRRYLAEAEGFGQEAAVLPFEVPGIDAALPWQGLPLAALHEMEGAGAADENGAAVTFLAGILARLVPARPVLWCLQRPDLHPPGLALAGLDAKRLVLLRAPDERDILWAMEEGLRSRALAAVVGEVETLSTPASRRLQLAAESAGVTGFVLHRSAGNAGTSAAVTRWRIAALPSAPVAGESGIGRPRWRVELLRCRGGMPAAWDVEACDGQSLRTTGHVAVPAALADRSALRQIRAAG
jgi:protein ImuA